MQEKYYFISDLHIGRADESEAFDCEKELILLLNKIQKEKNAELIIIGDFFELWKVQNSSPNSNLKPILNTHKELFAEFRKASKSIKITLIPGNHDRDLIFEKDIVSILKKYGINFEAKQHIIRFIGKNKIWIEHGSQYDNFNKFSDFYSKDSIPVGQFLSENIISNVQLVAKKGKEDWLKDMPAVYPNEEVPNWIFSNYFYKEMNPYLRYTAVFFITMLSISIFFWAGVLLKRFNFFNSVWLTPEIFSNVWYVGNYLERLITFNIFIISILLAMAIPFFFMLRDMKKAFSRYGLESPTKLKNKKETNIRKEAMNVFKKKKNVSVFIHGHTHNSDCLLIDGKKAIINTGTWTKKLIRSKAKLKFLPSIYHATYDLTYFSITSNDEEIIISRNNIHKDYDSNLNFLQKILIKKTKTKKSKINNDLIKIPL